jgi:rubredoxin
MAIKYVCSQCDYVFSKEEIDKLDGEESIACPFHPYALIESILVDDK